MLSAIIALIPVFVKIFDSVWKTPAEQRPDLLRKLLQMHQDLGNAVDKDLKKPGSTSEVEKFFNG